MRKTWRTAVAALAVLALVAAGCGDDDDEDVAGDDGGAGGGEVTVQIDGDTEEFNGAFLAYFPDKVTVHPGDTIVYESVFKGEPHSIAFGSIVTDAISEFRKLTPEQLESEGPPPPALDEAFSKIPPMLPEGPGDAIQSSVNPCFVVSGEVPTDPETSCEVTEPEPFTGEEVFYNSGFLADGETFELQLADDIAPGTYVGFCTLHFTEMISEVTVVAEDENVPSADEVEEQAQVQLDALVEDLASTYEEAKGGPDDGVAAGAFSEEVHNALVAEFLPKDFETTAGTPVKWTVNGAHTVSFNVSEDLRVFLAKGDDGRYHMNEKSFAPEGFEPPPPPEEEGEGPPPPTDGGTWDGTGSFNSGLLFGDFTLTFSKPGTYDYICVIHPDMEGTITVS